MRLDGKLASANGKATNFGSYRVEVHFTQKLKTEANAMESVLLYVGTVVRVDGSFAVELPSKDQLEDSLELQVFSPDGELLEIVKRPIRTLNDGETIKINIKPKEFPAIIKNPDPYLGCKVKLRGQIITENGKGVPGRAVALWARSKDVTPQIFLTSTTDKNGHFSGDYPSIEFEFEEAYGVVDVGGEVKENIPIHMEDGRIPQNVILVVKRVQDLEDGSECDCDMEIPRTPDIEDLVSSPGTYTTDLGGGRCVDFTAPNRTLEEFTFSIVVRTTEPTIKGLTLDEPNTWHNRSTFHLVDSILNVKNSLNRIGAATTTNGAETEGPVIRDIIKNINPRTMKSILRDPENITTTTLVNGAIRDMSDLVAHDLGRRRTGNPARGELTSENPIDWDDEPTFYQATTIAIGHLVQYKQKWKADGYSMGNLLYSVPLGPCQKKQIAIVDWERREFGRRAESMEEAERLTALMSRDRAITDIVNGAFTEGIHAKSEAGTSAVSGGFSIFGALSFGLLSLGGGGSVAGGTSGANSEAWQDSARKLTTVALNTLTDSIFQSASSFRSQYGTVVQTVEQQERVSAVTDVVSNNNHCHAITIEYFEILRHLMVTHECVSVQECLFVPLLMSRFDSSKALRWRTILRAFLIDKSFDRSFDALDRYYHNWDGSDLPEGRYSNDDILDLRGELRAYMWIERPKDLLQGDQYFPFEPAWRSLVDAGLLDGFLADDLGREGLGTRVWNNNLTDDREVASDQPGKDKTFQAEIAPYIATGFFDTQLEFYIRKENADGTNELVPLNIDATLTTHYSSNSELFVRLRSEGGSVNIRRDDIREFVIRVKGSPITPGTSALPPNSRLIITSSSMTYRSMHLDHSLYREAGVEDDLISSRETSFTTPTDHEERRDPRGEDRELTRRLISHLNENLEPYHKVIWLNMDKDRRFMLLDGFTAPNANGKSVASVVENKLIGIVGNSLILPVAPGFHLDPTYRIDKIDDLRHAYAATVPPLSIAIPTRGVYAESIMGKCNSCETMDDTKFWRFEESPCGVEPTPILPVGTETRRAEPGDLRPQQFPAPLVNLQNVPAAPEITGLEAALRLLSTPNIFQNLTGLDQTQKNALGALLSSADVAKFLAKEAAGLVRQNQLSRGVDKLTQKVDDAVKKGQITPETGEELQSKLLAGAIGGAADDNKMDANEATKLLDSAAAYGYNLDLTNSDGSISLKNPLAGIVETLSGAGSGVTTTRTSSTPQAALLQINNFNKSSKAGRWKLSKMDLVNRLRVLVNAPFNISQGILNVCGPAAFFHLYCKRDPVRFVMFAWDLYENGTANIGSLKVEPGSDLLNQDYYNNILPKLQRVPGGLCPPLDWMIMSALRDSENVFTDFEGTPEETISAATLPGTLTDWLDATGIYTNTQDESNLMFEKGLENAIKLKYSPIEDVVLFCNAHLLNEGLKPTGKRLSNEFIRNMFPDHLCLFSKPPSGNDYVKVLSNGQVEFTFWSWGMSPQTVSVPREVFQSNYYGTITATI